MESAEKPLRTRTKATDSRGCASPRTACACVPPRHQRQPRPRPRPPSRLPNAVGARRSKAHGPLSRRDTPKGRVYICISVSIASSQPDPFIKAFVISHGRGSQQSAVSSARSILQTADLDLVSSQQSAVEKLLTQFSQQSSVSSQQSAVSSQQFLPQSPHTWVMDSYLVTS